MPLASFDDPIGDAPAFSIDFPGLKREQRQVESDPGADRHLAPPAHPEGEKGSRRKGLVDLHIGPLNQNACRRVLKDAFHESQEGWQGSPLTLENDHEFPVRLCRRTDIKDLPKHPCQPRVVEVSRDQETSDHEHP